VSSAPDDPADFDSALLLDSEGKQWRVRSPRHAEASARLETEFLVLRAFAPGIRAELPCLMPTVAGTVRQGALSTFVYSHLAGTTRSVEELTAGPEGLAREVGAALAAIHDLPRTLVSNADLPSYTPNEFRQRRLNELDQAATTGKIPPVLLRRAALSAEFALAQYLVKGLAAGDQSMIGEAEEMLASLAADIAEHGGQPISVEPLPQSVPAVQVEPVPLDEPSTAAAMPAVHVAPIPVEQSAEPDAPASGPAPADSDSGRAADGPGETAPPAPPAADDTSTAALKIVDAKSH
jgi:hypothetical protein